MTYRT